MLSQTDINKIREIAKSFFEKTSFDLSLEFLNPEGETVFIKIKTEEPKVLIGQNGQTLTDIQRLLKAIIRKQIDGEFYIDIDVNDYKKKKTDYLREMAKESADEVVLTGREKKLFPMSSYERRIIHMALSERSGIAVESVGQEPDRRIVIRPL